TAFRHQGMRYVAAAPLAPARPSIWSYSVETLTVIFKTRHSMMPGRVLQHW
ncbi:uncharacterized protein METZ01_LOCUS447943, partial [marine metagenome]